MDSNSKTTPQDLADIIRKILDEADGDLQYHGKERSETGCHTCELVNEAEDLLKSWNEQNAKA